MIAAPAFSGDADGWGRDAPDNQFNATGGLTAALLMEAEMSGKPAITFKAIYDEHYITLETLRSFQPVVIHQNMVAICVPNRGLIKAW